MQLNSSHFVNSFVEKCHSEFLHANHRKQGEEKKNTDQLPIPHHITLVHNFRYKYEKRLL